MKNKERGAFQHLVLSYSSLLFTKAKLYSRNRQDAEDSLQDAFVIIYQKLDSFQGEELGRFLAWCNKIVINTSLAKYRRKHFSFERDEITEQTDVQIAPEVYQQFEREDLMRLIEMLPSGYKQVFSLFAIEGYSHKEIAELLQIKSSSSRSQYIRAKRKLNELMQIQSHTILSHEI